MKGTTFFVRHFGQVRPRPTNTKRLPISKNGLRAVMQKKLEDIPDVMRYYQSSLLADEFIDSSIFKYCTRFGIYQAARSLVATDKIIMNLFEHNKDVYIPVRRPKGIDMVRQKIVDISGRTAETKKVHLKSTVERGNALSDGGLDVIIIPGLAFTRNGHRLGTGLWQFDKFLDKYFVMYPQRYTKDMPVAAKLEKKKTILMGLALEEQIIPNERMPREEYDHKLDLILVT